MTIESNISAQTFLGDGEARLFPFTFRAFAGQVKVIVTAPDGGEEDVTSLCGIKLLQEGGGVVTYPIASKVSALPVGYKITILRRMDFTQETNLVTGARYSSEVLEQCLDKLTAQDQELKEELGRTLKVGVASDIPGGDIIQEVLNASSEAKAAAQNSSLDAASAAASAELAQKWAANPEDEPVAGVAESGPEFSAKHYASKLADIVERGVVATPAVPGFVPMGGEAGQFFGVSNDGLSYGFWVLPPAYQIGEFRNWFEQVPPPGWAVRNGAVLMEADVQYPELWEYLQTIVNEWKCKTLAEWTALSTAAGGVGGVPFFVLDDEAKTIKLPDTRGDYERAAGGGTMANVGDWHGDAIRNITGLTNWLSTTYYSSAGTGAIYATGGHVAGHLGGSGGGMIKYGIDASLVVPTATENRTRAFGMLGCVYIGGI